jgi:hypothetical protein
LQEHVTNFPVLGLGIRAYIYNVPADCSERVKFLELRLAMPIATAIVQYDNPIFVSHCVDFTAEPSDAGILRMDGVRTSDRPDG